MRTILLLVVCAFVLNGHAQQTTPIKTPTEKAGNLIAAGGVFIVLSVIPSTVSTVNFDRAMKGEDVDRESIIFPKYAAHTLQLVGAILIASGGGQLIKINKSKKTAINISPTKASFVYRF